MPLPKKYYFYVSNIQYLECVAICLYEPDVGIVWCVDVEGAFMRDLYRHNPFYIDP